MSLSPAEKKEEEEGGGGMGEKLVSTYLPSLKKELTVRVDWVVCVTFFFFFLVILKTCERSVHSL